MIEHAQHHYKGRRPQAVGRPMRPAMSFRDARIAQLKARQKMVRPVSAVMLNGYDCDNGLGFSLKPSKKLRAVGRAIKKNVTLKRALIAGAAIAAAPFVLPAAAAVGGALAHGAVAAGGLALRGARAAGGGIANLLHRPAANKNGPTQSPVDTKAIPDVFVPSGSSGPAAPSAPPAPQPIAPGPLEPAAAGGGGGGMVGGGDVAAPSAAPADAASATPEAAGVAAPSSLPMLALAAAGLLVLSRSSGRLKRRRSRR